MRSIPSLIPTLTPSLLTVISVIACCAMAAPALHAQEGVTISRWNKSKLIINAPANQSVPAGLKLKLQVLVTMNIQEIDLVDAIEQLQRLTGVNIVIDPRLRTDDRPITLNVRNMKASTVVKWMTELGDCHVSYMNEAVYFSKEKAKGINKISIIDVGDLVMPIQNFVGPTMQIPQGGDTGGMFISEVPEVEEADAEDIIEIISEVLENQGVEVE